MDKPIIDIFIRTYYKDFDILFYCLYSIKKYCKNYRDIIICIKEKDYNLFSKRFDLEGLKIIKEHNYDNKIDYVGQQISKLYADIWSDAEYFYYVDSDCIFYKEVDIIESYFNDRKPIIWKDYWKDSGPAICWQPCLKYLDLNTEFEFMRRLPQVYPSKCLKDIRRYIEEKTGKDFINGCIFIFEKYKFSEFNIMGSFIYNFDPEIVNFIFSKENNKTIYAKQFWSGENPKKLISDIKNLLKISINI